MATRIYGLSRGENMDQVTEGVGSAVAADGIELTVDLAVSLTKEDVLLALEKFEYHIIKGNWPPA
jgi:hypothetical protein